MDIRPRKRAYLIPAFIAVIAIAVVIYAIYNLGMAMMSLHNLDEQGDYTNTFEEGDVIMIMADYYQFPAEIDYYANTIYFNATTIELTEISGDATVELQDGNTTTSINNYYTFAYIVMLEDSEITLSQVSGGADIVVADISTTEMVMNILLLVGGILGGIAGTIIPIIVISIKRKNSKMRQNTQQYYQPQPKQTYQSNNDYDF